MYNTTDSYKSKIYNVNHFLKVYINDAEIESKYILDCRPSSTLFTNGEIELGSTPSQTVELKLYKSVVPATINKVEIKSGITGEIVPIGIYNVDKASTSDDYTVTLSLADNMIKFEFNYDGSKLVNDNDGKVKIIRVLQDICSKANVELGSTSFLNMNKVIAVYDNTVSARTYLSYIAEQAGGFAFIGRDGKLYIKSFKYALGKKIGEGKSFVIEKTNNLRAKTVIKGEYSQKTTQGINFLEIALPTQTYKGVTFTNNGDGSFTLNGTATADLDFRVEQNAPLGSNNFNAYKGTYTFYCSNLKSGMWFGSATYDDGAYNFFMGRLQGNVSLLTREVDVGSGFFYIHIVSGTTVRELTLKPMFVKGSYTLETIPDFEPYTGGKPSPSSDYPQKIETVGSNVQLLDNPFINGSANGISWIINDDGTMIIDGTTTANTSIFTNNFYINAKEGETVTLSATGLTNVFNVGYKSLTTGKDIFVISGNNPINTKTLTADDLKNANRFHMYIQAGKTFNNQVIKIKLEKGTKATPYSPYGQGSVEVIKQNKNFLYYEAQNQSTNGINFTVNSDKSIQISGTATAVVDFYLIGSATNYESINLQGAYKINGCNSGSTSKYMLYVVKKSKYGTLTYYQNVSKDNEINIAEGDTFRIFIRVLSGVTVSDTIYPMLRLSTETDDTYVEAKKESYIMPIQQEMLDGDYIDNVEHHTWEKLVLDGSEDWLVGNAPNQVSTTYFASNFDVAKSNSNYSISNYFSYVPNLWSKDKEGVYIDFLHGYDLRIRISKGKASTIAEFKAWLKSKYDEGNPVIIYYKLATPIDLALTEEQKKVLKEIHNMDLYEDYTIIESDTEIQVNFARAEIPFKYFQNFKWGAKYKLSKIRYEDGIRVFEKGDDTGNTLYINPDNMFIVDQDQIDNIYDELKDLELYSFKGDSIVDPALDIGDIVVIDGKQVLYCGSSQYSGRWKASINSEIKSKERQETTRVKKPSQKTINRRVQSSIDQVNGKIEQLIEENTETSEKLTKHEQDINSIKDIVESIEDFTREVSSYQELHLTDTADYAENLVLTLTIYGNTEKWKELAPSTSLAPSTLLAPLGATIDLIVDSQSRLNPSEDKQVFTINYGKKLRSLGNVRDELDIINNKVTIIRRIGLNDSGQEYVLQTEQTEELGELKLPTLKDNTYIYIREYPNLEYFCRYITDNEYIKKFATQEGLKEATVNLNTKIEQSNKEIILLARQKVGKDEIIASINLTPEKAKILAKLIELEGIVTANQNFKILLDGSMEATNGKFTGGKIQLENGSSSNPTFLIGTGSTQSFLTNEGFYANSDTFGKAYIFVDGNEGAISILGNSGQTFIRPNKVSTTGEMWATAYNYQSQAKLKENIVKFKREALYMIKNSDIYEFNYKNNSKEKTIGLVIGDGYNTPQEIISNKKGINSYSMVSISWKAIQELDQKIEKMINILKKIPIFGRIFTKRWKNEKNNK